MAGTSTKNPVSLDQRVLKSEIHPTVCNGEFLYPLSKKLPVVCTSGDHFSFNHIGRNSHSLFPP